MQKYTLNVTEEVLNMIIEGLMELPVKRSLPIITQLEKIKQDTPVMATKKENK